MDMLTFIREGAVQTAVHGTDVREREDARNLARAIDHLATEMRSRLDTALLQNQRETDGRRFWNGDARASESSPSAPAAPAAPAAAQPATPAPATNQNVVNAPAPASQESISLSDAGRLLARRRQEAAREAQGQPTARLNPSPAPAGPARTAYGAGRVQTRSARRPPTDSYDTIAKAFRPEQGAAPGRVDWMGRTAAETPTDGVYSHDRRPPRHRRPDPHRHGPGRGLHLQDPGTRPAAPATPAAGRGARHRAAPHPAGTRQARPAAARRSTARPPHDRHRPTGLSAPVRRLPGRHRRTAAPRHPHPAATASLRALHVAAGRGRQQDAQREIRILAR